MAFQENGGKVQACSGVITGWLTRDSSQGFAHSGIAMSIFFYTMFPLCYSDPFLMHFIGSRLWKDRREKGQRQGEEPN